MFMVGGLLTPIVLGVALWRAHVLPWWAALGLLIWLAAVLMGSELMLGALLNLALLLPFAAVARRLRPAPERPQQPRTVVPEQAR